MTLCSEIYLKYAIQRVDLQHDSSTYMTEVITLELGQSAPAFSTLDSKAIPHDSNEILESGKKIILYFYPRDSTPGCTTQACDFRDDLSRFESKGYAVFGVSKDSEKSHEKFITNQELNFPLLMDEDGSLHDAFGTWRKKMNYGREYMGCARSTFVIDTDGQLIFARYNVKAKGHVAMLARELGIDG
jgi:thioredoxin-dependent peroxiredoxin